MSIKNLNSASFYFVALLAILVLASCQTNRRVALGDGQNRGGDIEEDGGGGVIPDDDDEIEEEEEEEEDLPPVTPAPTCGLILPSDVQQGETFSTILIVRSGAATSARIKISNSAAWAPVTLSSGWALVSIPAVAVGIDTVRAEVTGPGGTSPLCAENYTVTAIPVAPTCTLVKTSTYTKGQPITVTMTTYGQRSSAFINGDEVPAVGGSVLVYPDLYGNYFANGEVFGAANLSSECNPPLEYYPPQCTLTSSTTAYGVANLVMTLFGEDIDRVTLDGVGKTLPAAPANTINIPKDGSSGTATGVIYNTLGESSSCSVPYQITPRPEESIWTNSTIPPWIERDSSAAGGLELGMKFRVTVPGKIYGIRFWKDSRMGGTHRGTIWLNGNVTPLRSVNFTSETASGWQQVYFATPVTVAANTTYIASYYSRSEYFPKSRNNGGTTERATSFLYAQTNGHIQGLASGTDGPNGVYKYGNGDFSPLYPNHTDANGNYWVDVIFSPDFGQ